MNYNRHKTHNCIRLIKIGAKFFQLLADLIDKAKHTIFIRTYIWDDETGTQLADQLINAAKRKVGIYSWPMAMPRNVCQKALQEGLGKMGYRSAILNP
jgi:phosphatidylserine/phosphatidylglycerophosphate/cardiolipin synthase-like enzyme